MSITVGGLDLKDTSLDLKDGDIECTATKIVDSNNVVGGLIKTVSEGSSGGLVDNTENVETGDLAGIFSGLTLGVVEVGGNGDDGILDVLAHIGLGGLLHLSEHEATDLGRRVLLALGLEPGITVGMLDNLVGHLLDILLDLSVGELATNETLGSEEGVFGVDDGLALGGNADEALALLCEANNGGCCAATWRES